MKKALGILLAFIISWMFFYPLTFRFLPASVNSKMMVAVLGIILYINEIMKDGGVRVNKWTIWQITLASLFSISCLVSITINNTYDMDYVSYVVSMFVWLGAAYGSVQTINRVHGYKTISIISYYIIALCCIQALVSLLFSLYPTIQSAVNSFIVLNSNNVTWESRLYGLGASSDTGGIKFCIGLILIAHQFVNDSKSVKQRIVLFICFIIIFLFGNMMSRTTTIGGIIAVCYGVAMNMRGKNVITFKDIRTLFISVMLILLTIPVAKLSFQKSPVIENLARFGFEGFFSYAETGQWSTRSNNNLKDMWSVWPDNPKTWLIGDGRFIDPDDPKLFYMHTDVGYARFIFYCGLIGLFLFAFFFFQLCMGLSQKYSRDSMLFWVLLLLEYVIWIKVSTDIFLIFAFLSCASSDGIEKDGNLVTSDDQL